MKLVKGVTIFLVLCLAAYGVFTLLKKEPIVDLNESDISRLKDMGIDVSNGGRASGSGLSGMFDVEGADPIGAVNSATGSAPPSFMVEPTTSSVAPFHAEAAPHVAMFSPEQQPIPPHHRTQKAMA